MERINKLKENYIEQNSVLFTRVKDKVIKNLLENPEISPTEKNPNILEYHLNNNTLYIEHGLKYLRIFSSTTNDFLVYIYAEDFKDTNVEKSIEENIEIKIELAFQKFFKLVLN